MAIPNDYRPRSLEVQRAQAEERRQRLEEQHYHLTAKRHDVEKAKIIVDVIKHFTAVITALLFIVAYFGDQIIPAMRERSTPFLNLTAWDIGIVALAGSLVFSLQALVDFALDPELHSNNPTAKRWLSVTMWLLLIAVILLVAALLVG
jgi:hypothetical protein